MRRVTNNGSEGSNPSGSSTNIMIDESHLPVSEQSLIFRLRKRAEIRRSIQTRKSVQENRPDRIADLLDEAANALERLKNK